jgi:rhodanese-related sulfurtransferase
VRVLDVRLAGEYEDSHIEGAQNVPIGELLDRIDEIPQRELWIHCGSGYRASIAASVLAARDHQVVLIDDAFDNAGDAGLPMTSSD